MQGPVHTAELLAGLQVATKGALGLLQVIALLTVDTVGGVTSAPTTVLAVLEQPLLEVTITV